MRLIFRVAFLSFEASLWKLAPHEKLDLQERPLPETRDRCGKRRISALRRQSRGIFVWSKFGVPASRNASQLRRQVSFRRRTCTRFIYTKSVQNTIWNPQQHLLTYPKPERFELCFTVCFTAYTPNTTAYSQPKRLVGTEDTSF